MTTTTDFCELNYGQIFFMMCSFIPAAICLPCWLVAKFVYEPFVKQVENEEEDTPDIPFEFQFPIEKAEDDDRDSEETFKKSVILSNTPDGLVYMRYSKEEKGFEYWSDKTITYKYLETVARKYVTVFACKKLYIDRFALLLEKVTTIKEEIAKNQEEKEKQKENKDEGTQETEDVFVNLKAYNKKGKDIKNQTEIWRKDVVCDEANKYINRGKIKDAVFGEKSKPKGGSTSSMSFGNWKLWRRGNKED